MLICQPVFNLAAVKHLSLMFISIKRVTPTGQRSSVRNKQVAASSVRSGSLQWWSSAPALLLLSFPLFFHLFQSFSFLLGSALDFFDPSLQSATIRGAEDAQTLDTAHRQLTGGVAGGRGRRASHLQLFAIHLHQLLPVHVFGAEFWDILVHVETSEPMTNLLGRP